MKTTKNLNVWLAMSMFLLLMVSTAAGATIYVDANANGMNDGSSWADAYNYLQDALAAALSGDEIRVAQGIYKPDEGANQTPGDRTATFQLISGVAIRGGYAGFGEPDANARDIELYETILSGDLNGDDVDVNDPCGLLTEPTRAENSYHVVTGSGSDPNALLDGFTITAGNDDRYCPYPYSPGFYPCGYGGGFYNRSGSPTVINCTFSGNSASWGGGGMYNYDYYASPTVIDCMFSGNSARSGGGIDSGFDSAPTLTRCIFACNSATYRGGGISGYCGPITDCTITGNSAYYGGGISMWYCGSEVRNCTIGGNRAQYRGGGMCTLDSSPKVLSCMFTGNSAGDAGGGMCNIGAEGDGDPVLIGCTFSGNSAPNGTAVALDLDEPCPHYFKMANCILWDGGNEIWDNGGWEEITVTYCNVQSGWPDEGNIDVDPCFVQPGYWDANGTWVEGDYHLMLNSPCINVGDPNYMPGPNETDLDSNARVIGGRIDMGAYESIKQAFLFRVKPESVIVPEGRTAKFKVSLQSDPKGMVEVAVTHRSGDSDITVESGEILTFDPSNYSKPQTVTLAAAEDVDPHEGTALIWVDAPGFALVVVNATEEENETASSILYVDANAAGANDGTCWRDAFTDLQDALTWAAVFPQVEEIRVAKGTYKPDQGLGIKPRDRTATFQLINGVTIKGGYAGYGHHDPDVRDIKLYETILTGDLRGNDDQTLDPQDLLRASCRADNSYHVVTASGTDETTVLDGLTITAGNANGRTNQDHRGGGIFNNLGSPRFTNCTFTGNAAYHLGGAMYNYKGSPTVTNCTFRKNSTPGNYGGAMHNDNSSPTLIGCNFTDNSAGIGGAISNVYNCSPTLINCVFSDNFAGSGGAIDNCDSSPILVNCTLRRNYARSHGGGIYNRFDGNPTLANCTFSSNSSGDEGGGIYNIWSNPILINCTVSGNTAGENGGGIHNHRSNPTLANSIFSRNSATYGGGMTNYSGSTVAVANCTFVGNLAVNGKALACDSRDQKYASDVEVTNCIIWDGGDEIWNNDNSIITITYSDVQGGWPGEGNIDVDPLFVEPGYWDANGVWVDGDYHLLRGSPCIDAGDPNHPDDPNETDLDGKPRIIGGRIDMGAYEYRPLIPAEVDIDPDTLNLASKGKWITCYIWLPEDYDVADIDPNSVFLEGEIRAEPLWVYEQEQLAIAKFSRSEVQGILNIGEIELTITGQLKDGTAFEGTDVIRVIDKGGKK